MRPIRFQCESPLLISRDALFAGIADPASWTSFTGYGPLPGIRTAAYVQRTPEMLGSVIRVTNTDGSTHTETIMLWEPGRTITMELAGFSPPLAGLASHFTEEWDFPDSTGTPFVRRTMILHPRGARTRPLLWLISLLLRRALARHLRQIAAPAP